jgi:hypothetical protein
MERMCAAELEDERDGIRPQGVNGFFGFNFLRFSRGRAAGLKGCDPVVERLALVAEGDGLIEIGSADKPGAKASDAQS